MVGEGQHRVLGSTEKRLLTWALEVREGFLGKPAAKLGPKR